MSPDNGLWDSKILTIFLLSINLFKMDTLEVGVKLLIKSDLMEEDEIFLVYGISNNLPLFFFSNLITFCLVFF